MSAVASVTDQNFQTEVLSRPGLTVVDVWAPWCGPCRMLAPIIDDLAGDPAVTARFVKLNSDENADTAVKYNVRSIPTLLFFKDGQLVDRTIGVQPKGELKKLVDKHAG